MILLFALQPLDAKGFSHSFQGELSGWVTVEPNSDQEFSGGLRYIPLLSTSHDVTANVQVDSEMSVNIYETGRFDTLDNHEFHGKLKPYRAWLRLSTSQWEIRAGLQKISFGAAALLRPLMWFDRIDPRDPLELTEGVYGLLSRYYFLNNANIWLWGLYGNEAPKGWEVDHNDGDRPELGGRIQVPVYTGEMGLSYHHRRAQVENNPLDISSPQRLSVPENRIGIDGKLDLGVGIWMEGALVRQNRSDFIPPYRRLITIGIDYTFACGNGIHLLMEHFATASSKKVFGHGNLARLSAASVSYPLGLLDRLSAIVYYDWERRNWYRYAAWQRTYDHWDLYLMGFLNPSQTLIFTDLEAETRISGKGFRIMVVYNH